MGNFISPALPSRSHYSFSEFSNDSEFSDNWIFWIFRNVYSCTKLHKYNLQGCSSIFGMFFHFWKFHFLTERLFVFFQILPTNTCLLECSPIFGNFSQIQLSTGMVRLYTIFKVRLWITLTYPQQDCELSTTWLYPIITQDSTIVNIVSTNPTIQNILTIVVKILTIWSGSQSC